MPELPEVETIARGLEREIAGATIVAVRVRRPDVLRYVTPAQLGRKLRGATIGHSWRRAKFVILDLSTGDRLVVQPRFTGGLLVDRGDLPPDEQRYSTLALRLADGRALHYCDVRRLGTVALMSPSRFQAHVNGLGVEPLEADFTAERFRGLLRSSRQAVKKRIMDQRIVAGVGNIYANEALWRSGIDPSRRADALSPSEATALRHAIVRVLADAVAARGTSFRDYRGADGARGDFAVRLAVYGRAGERCLRCGARLIGTHAIDGRITVLCAHCQE